MNTANSIKFTFDNSVLQGTYGFFISTPNSNTSESPFFSVISDASPTCGLSTGAKVGIGLGVSIPCILLLLSAFLLLRRPNSTGLVAQSKRLDDTADHNTAELNASDMGLVELGEDQPHELPGDR
jgi:hypothetical protein